MEAGALRSERKRARGPAAIFERPSSQEAAALAWVHDHLDDERAQAISKDMGAWSADLNRVQRTPLAKSQGIRLGRQRLNNKDQAPVTVRKYFMEKIAQERGRQIAFTGLASSTGAALGPSSTGEATVVELDIDDIETMAQLRLFRRQHPELPEALRSIMCALAGKPTWIQLQHQQSPLYQLCQDTLEMPMEHRFTVYRGDTLKFKRFRVPLRYQVAMLRTACLSKVRIDILRASQAKGDTAQGAGEEMQTSGHPQAACAQQAFRGDSMG